MAIFPSVSVTTRENRVHNFGCAALEDAGLGGLSDADLELAATLAGYDSLDGYMSTFAMAGLGMLAMLGTVLAIIFTWLPANGRYKKALKGVQ